MTAVPDAPESSMIAGRARSSCVVDGSSSGRSGANALWPRSRSAAASGVQHELSCHLPWIRQKVAIRRA
jgi:hypothetical protein